MKMAYYCFFVLGCLLSITVLQAQQTYAVRGTTSAPQESQQFCPCGCGCYAPCHCGCTQGRPCTCHPR